MPSAALSLEQCRNQDRIAAGSITGYWLFKPLKESDIMKLTGEALKPEVFHEKGT